MDSSSQQDNSPDAIRERVENKSDEFAGGPSAGWQTMEAAVDDTRHEAAQDWSETGGSTATATTPTTAGQTSTDLERDTVSASSSSTETVRGVDSAEEMPPFNEEHPLGVGQQCTKCGAYNDLEADACWNCGTEISHSMTETPGIVESVMATDTEEMTGRDAGDTGTSGTGGAQPLPHL